MVAARPRVVLVFPSRSYRVDAFVAAARRQAVELVLATDLPAAFARFGEPTAEVDLRAPEAAAARLASVLKDAPPRGVLGADETSAVVAALVAERLGLAHSEPAGVYATRDKRRMREMLAAAGVASPAFRVLPAGAEPRSLLDPVRFPCVVKPPMLTGSQGVIRADDAADLERAVSRVRRILEHHPSDASGEMGFHDLLLEDFVPGREVSVEAVARDGRLEPLAVFDKPDALDGPFFEETIYVTPSRLSAAAEGAILDTAAAAARALGLSQGPIHAELRSGHDGRATVIEIAARSIGGLCSRVFDFAAGSLEDLLLAHALGRPIDATRASSSASGVMMIPIPRSGVLRKVEGLEAARAVAGVEDVTVAIRPGESIRALPEGASYLGFIVARASSPARVEAALRAAHAALRFDLSPLLDLV